MTDPSSSSFEQASEIYSDYLERLNGGESGNIEDLCAAHPEHATALRRLDSLFERGEPMMLNTVVGSCSSPERILIRASRCSSLALGSTMSCATPPPSCSGPGHRKVAAKRT